MLLEQENEPIRKPVEPLSVEMYTALPERERFELLEGHLKERGMGAKSSSVGGELYFRLRLHLRDGGAGRVYPSDTGFACFGSPRKVRYPDISFLTADHPEAMTPPQGFITVAPELAIEVVSPKDLAEDIEERRIDFLTAGTKVFLIVYPNTRTVHMHRADGSCSLLPKDGVLSIPDILPGFECGLVDLFDS